MGDSPPSDFSFLRCLLGPLFGFGLIAVAHAEPAFYQARVAPIFDHHCVVCHGDEKQKGKLRLDSFAAAQAGGEDGAIFKPGAPADSEIMRRVSLPRDDDEAMPSDGKPALSADEIKILELWIKAGASETLGLNAFPGAPVATQPPPPPIPLAPDWHAKAAAIAQLERTLGVRLVPRSQIATDGLVLRTASAPQRCDDAALAQLAPVAEFIVEAELARTKVTDAGLPALARCANLRALDLTRTKITSPGLAALAPLQKLESLNLTETAVDEHAAEVLRALPALRRVWTFDVGGSR